MSTFMLLHQMKVSLIERLDFWGREDSDDFQSKCNEATTLF